MLKSRLPISVLPLPVNLLLDIRRATAARPGSWSLWIVASHKLYHRFAAVHHRVHQKYVVAALRLDVVWPICVKEGSEVQRHRAPWALRCIFVILTCFATRRAFSCNFCW